MSIQSKLAPVAIALALILGAGYVHGVSTHRWTVSAEIRNATAKVASIPLTFGDWTAKESPLDERQAKIGRIEASISRQYVNAKTGQAVSVLLVCGRPGPISVHTPEVCYAGSGYKVESERKRVAYDYDGNRKASFWSIKVSKPEILRPERMSIDYGWFANQTWSAPDMDARFEYAGIPILYKLYVIREQSRMNDRSGTDTDPTPDFLKDFLPMLQKIL